jgi:hypothetical protein
MNAKSLAKKAGFNVYEHIWIANEYDIERFAELVRQDERNLRRTKKEWSDYERAIAADERERVYNTLISGDCDGSVKTYIRKILEQGANNR